MEGVELPGGHVEEVDGGGDGLLAFPLLELEGLETPLGIEAAFGADGALGSTLVGGHHGEGLFVDEVAFRVEDIEKAAQEGIGAGFVNGAGGGGASDGFAFKDVAEAFEDFSFVLGETGIGTATADDRR